MIIGASENPERYSNKAVKALMKKNFPVNLLGKTTGKINDIEIKTGFPKFENIHTVSLYLNPVYQEIYYDYIISLKPERVIFNPGAENPAFMRLLESNNIAAEDACTLVLLSLNAY